jgi:branched-chain amino acid aminotransferase
MNGELMPLEDAGISPLDHGLVVGDGVFETLRVYDGVPFAWTRHARRLHASADGLGLTAPDAATLRDAANAVLAANELREARLRITVTGGPAPPGSRRAPVPPTVIVVGFELEPTSPTASVMIVPWTRNEGGALAGLKTISYAENVRALAYVEERGAHEAIFPNTKGNLCEATGSNVFLVLNGVCVTPPLAAGCLNGVTRQLLLELGNGGLGNGELDIPIEERDVPVGALAEADEAFVSSTVREVQPIATVDGQALPTAPGPVTTKLAAAFTALTKRDPNP